MWILSLTCLIGAAILTACLRGFHAAMKEKRAIWAVLIRCEEDEDRVIKFPYRESPTVNFHKAA